MAKLSLNGHDWTVSGWWTNQWRMGKTMELSATMDATVAPIPASVPGSVQADLKRAGLLEDPNFGLDSIKGEWVNNREWIYDKTFQGPTAQGRCELCFEGLDYHGEIYLNGQKLTEFCGMFVPVTIDITPYVKRGGANLLRVVFFKTPEVDGQFGYSNRIRILKSRFNYIWDWCPRIIPVGIWEDAYLRTVDEVTVRDFFPKAAVTLPPECMGELNQAEGAVTAKVCVQADRPGEYTFAYTVRKEGRVVHETSCTEALLPCEQTVEHRLDVGPVALWWPNTYGDQPLYDIEVRIIKDGRALDAAHRRIGFREVAFVKNPGSQDNALPYTLMVNGRRIFLRGVDWVPISPDYGTVSREDYHNFLRRFRDMNSTILRIWGGAILEKHDFYDLCDEMGLLVWQEFPQSSSGINNTPPDDPELLKELKRVAEVFVVKRRHHASHVIWCGGNELMWEGNLPITDNHINIAMLKNLVEKLDPGKCFLPSSASGPVFVPEITDFGTGNCHDVHGPWRYLGDREHYAYFNADDSLFRSETGTAGASRLDTLYQYRGEYAVWPPDGGNPLWKHRGAWWIQMEELTTLFGPWEQAELPLYIQASRYLQAESLRYSAEATRRREPEASGYIIWMGNEPYPNTANTSVIEYDGTPKPAYYAMQRAFADRHVSLRYDSVGQKSGKAFPGEAFVHGSAGGHTVCARCFDMLGNILFEKRAPAVTGKAMDVDWKVEPLPGQVFFVRLSLMEGETVLCENTYGFTIDAERPFEPLRRLPKADCTLSQTGGRAVVHNRSACVAVGVFLCGEDSGAFASISPNYLTLMPGESREIQASAQGPLLMEGLNLAARDR